MTSGKAPSRRSSISVSQPLGRNPIPAYGEKNLSRLGETLVDQSLISNYKL
jgi:hypothetical protein